MKTATTYPIISVPFKGAYYMCIEGSSRASLLHYANRAWTMGYEDLTKKLHKAALDAPGCAFEARENMPRD